MSSDQQPTAATNGPGVAVGRPETPETPLGAEMSFYRNSSCQPCALCGRPTWYGPGLMEKIAGGALPACGDCAFAALLMGAAPSRIEHLGGEAVVLGSGGDA